MKTTHYPATTITGEHYKVVEPAGEEFLVWVSRIGQHHKLSCNCNATTKPCIHIQAITNPPQTESKDALRELHQLEQKAYDAGRFLYDKLLAHLVQVIDRDVRVEVARYPKAGTPYTSVQLREYCAAQARQMIPDVVSPHIVLHHTGYPEAYRNLSLREVEYEFYRKAAVRALVEDLIGKLERLGTPGSF